MGNQAQASHGRARCGPIQRKLKVAGGSGNHKTFGGGIQKRIVRVGPEVCRSGSAGSDHEPSDRTVFKQMFLDDFFDIGLIDIAIPDPLGIDHHDWSLGAPV